MKRLFYNLKNKKIRERLRLLYVTIMSTLMITECKVYAAAGTDSIDSFINFACDWLKKIGGVVALVGGVIFCLRMAKRRCRRKE